MGYTDEAEDPITNDFDFEESNKLFEKEDEIPETATPAYKKDDFFDNLQDGLNDKYYQCIVLINRGTAGGNRYRGKDAETFGQRSLNERYRENRGRNFRGPYRGRRGGYYGNRPNRGNETQ